MGDAIKSAWQSEAVRLAIIIITAILGATGVQIALPARSDPFTGSQGKEMAVQIAELKGKLEVMSVTLQATEAKLTAMLLQYEHNKPPQSTRDRIESLEEELNKQSGYRPPHRKWQ